MTSGSSQVFEDERSRLRSIAYRMLGSLADTDDVIQDAWLRWDRRPQAEIDNPAAFLTTVVTRLALDRLRARTRDQDRYVGPWLPEPIVRDPGEISELADDLTFASLVLLEALSPDERAVILLADVFGTPFPAIAETLGRSADSCRQLAVRARRKLRSHDRDRPTVSPDGGVGRELVDRLLVAVVTDDEDAALACVHPDVVLTSDGGPTRRAARHPIVGAVRVTRFLRGLVRHSGGRWSVEPVDVDGLVGIVLRAVDDLPVVICFEHDETRITAVWSVLAPDKLSSVMVPADGSTAE